MTHSHPKPETRLTGIGVSPGVSIGPAERIGRALEEPERILIERSLIEEERDRLNEAIVKTRSQILALQEEIGTRADGASILDAHLLILEDSALLSEVFRIVETEKLSIDWVYYSVSKRYIDTLRKVADPYLRDRAEDIEDVARRLLHNLRLDGGELGLRLQYPDTAILFARDLSPSDMIAVDRAHIRGFATELGSPTSHSAIMARSLNIPAVVALHGIPDDFSAGEIAIVDGRRGLVILRPSQETLSSYEIEIEREKSLLSDLGTLRSAKTQTADGFQLTLSANLEFVEELDSIRDSGAEGVGLYRTEFFYISQSELRSEENQAENYARVVQAMHPHGATIRTLDIGGDKFCPELFEHPEPNPFLGWRGIRLSLDRQEEFRTQLRAILRASAFGKTRIMFPFICSLKEVRAARQQVEIAKDELRQQGVAFDEQIEVGVMIEIPSAVMIADHIAKEVDFFSIGTNDLIQYATAVDRVNDRVAHLYQPAHPAVIAMVRETIAAAHRNGIWCGICGEVASDPVLAPLWIGLKVDELSVGVAQVLRMRRVISRLRSTECQKLAESVLNCGTADEILALCRDLTSQAYPELLS